MPLSVPVFAWLGTTAAGIFLFLFLIRRRPRDDSPSLATFVLESSGPVAPLPAAPVQPASVAPPAAAAIGVKGTTPSKRTRNRKAPGKPSAPAPSAAASRSAGPAAVAPASAFAKPPAKGVERVFVSYQGVRMAALPDEFQPMLARLERGDEVEIIGSQDGYLNVRTPTGLTGWIPRVTVTGGRPTTRGGTTPAPN